MTDLVIIGGGPAGMAAARPSRRLRAPAYDRQGFRPLPQSIQRRGGGCL